MLPPPQATQAAAENDSTEDEIAEPASVGRAIGASPRDEVGIGVLH